MAVTLSDEAKAKFKAAGLLDWNIKDINERAKNTDIANAVAENAQKFQAAGLSYWQIADIAEKVQDADIVYAVVESLQKFQAARLEPEDIRFIATLAKSAGVIKAVADNSKAMKAAGADNYLVSYIAMHTDDIKVAEIIITNFHEFYGKMGAHQMINSARAILEKPGEIAQNPNNGEPLGGPENALSA